MLDIWQETIEEDRLHMKILLLAGVVTFLVQGIRPLTWWETTRARKATRTAIILWTSLLFALVIFILLAQKG